MNGSLNDPFSVYSFPTSLGMNNRYNELDFDGKWVLLAQNARFAQMPGSVIKRQPLAYYNTSTISATQGIVGLYRFYSVYGPVLIAVCGSNVYVGNDSTGAMTSICTLSSTSKPMSFVTYNNLMIASNGYDEPFVYDGSPSAVTWQLGSCQALTGISTGITATAVSYAITMDNNAFICGAVSNTIASLSNQNVVLSYIPLGPAGTADRKIYRKDSGTSGNYKLVATISDNSTTTYTDNTVSGSLGVNMGVTTDAIPMGAWLLIFAERLFITADPNNPNRIYYSEPFLPGYIQVNTNLDYLDVAKDDGDQIQGIVAQSGDMICIKQNNMRKLSISNATSNVDPATWHAEDPFCHTGTPARYSICSTPWGIVLLSWDAWYLYDGGGQAKPFIPQFDPTQILPSAYANVVTCYNDGMVYASYTSVASGYQYPTQVMVYDMKLGQFSMDTYSAGCFASATGVNESGELFIGDATQGLVYKAEEGDIFSSVSSLNQALNGTTAGTFIGGVQNDAFIQIGAPVAASAIPTGICIFWDDSTTVPGSGWTEVTGYQYAYPVISTVSGNTGGSSLHSHVLSGNTAVNQGGSYNAGDGNAHSDNSAHSHPLSGNTDSMFADPNNFGMRIFYKNASTTEYDFPLGAVLMWDQQTPPDGWIGYTNSNNGYVQINTPVSTAPTWVVGTSYTVGQYVTATDPFSQQAQIYYCQIAHTAGAYDNAWNTIMSTNTSNQGSTGQGQPAPAYTFNPITVTFADDLYAGYWKSQNDNLGFMATNSHAHPYGVSTPLATGYDSGSTSNSDSGSLDGYNPHRHYIIGVTNSTNTSGGSSGNQWDLDRIEVSFIKKLVADETPWDGTSKNVLALFWDTGAPASPSNGWTEIGGTVLAYNSATNYPLNSLVTYSGLSYQCILACTNQTPNSSPTYWTAYSAPQIYIKSMSNYIVGYSNNAYTHNHGNTPAAMTSFAIDTWGNGGYRSSCPHQHQHTYVASTVGAISDPLIPNPAWVSFRLWSKPLGKMTSWNDAVTTTYTNGLYYSLPLQLNVATFGELFFNSSKLPTDYINFYFRTAATQAALTTGLSPTMGSNTFTSASHGLVNGNRVSVIATSMPTGLSATIMYYVINAATNTFQVSLTNGGSAVTFSGGSGVTIMSWSNEIVSSDTIIASTPNVWVSYVIEFIAADTTNSNPTLITANEFMLRFSYRRAGEIAESAVEFIYTTGRLNQMEPMVDKIYRRIASDHTGGSGQVQITWATENASNAWTFDLSSYPNKWASFFHDAAMGESVNITYYKNDLNDFNLRMFKLQYQPQPMII